MYYPIDCAFVPKTLSEDGDPCDALAVSQVPVTHGAVIRCRPIGALLMEDELNRTAARRPGPMGQEISRAAKCFCVETGVVGFEVQLQTDCLFCRCVEVVSDITSEDLLDKDCAVSNPCLYYESWLRRRPQEARDKWSSAATEQINIPHE